MHSLLTVMDHQPAGQCKHHTHTQPTQVSPRSLSSKPKHINTTNHHNWVFVQSPQSIEQLVHQHNAKHTWTYLRGHWCALTSKAPFTPNVWHKWDDSILWFSILLFNYLNLQPSAVTFPQVSIYQKLLKSVHVWQSYSKTRNTFCGTRGICPIAAVRGLTCSRRETTW